MRTSDLSLMRTSDLGLHGPRDDPFLLCCRVPFPVQCEFVFKLGAFDRRALARVAASRNYAGGIACKQSFACR